MEQFVNTKRFADMNVAVTLDEGLASPDETFTVFYGERAAWCTIELLLNLSQLFIYRGEGQSCW